MSGERVDAWSEGLGWAAAAVALLLVNPYGDLGPESDRFLVLQMLGLVALVALAARRVTTSAALATGDVSREEPTGLRRLAEEWIRSPLAGGAIAWGLSGVVATVASVDPLRSLLGAPPRLSGLASELALLALFLALTPGLAAAQRRERLETALLAAGGAAVAYGLVQWAGLDPLLWQEEWQGRPVAAQGNPLFLAQALVFLVPLAAGRALARRDERRAPAAAAAALLGLLALAVAVRTGARGPLLGLGAAAAVFFASAGLSSGRARARRAGGVLAVALGLALVVGAAVAYGRADRLGGTAGQRVLLWKSVAQLFERSPRWHLVTGFGQESLPIVLPPFLPPELPERIWRPDLYHDRAHNAVLDALASGGLLRLACELGLLVAGIAMALRLAGVRRRGDAEEPRSPDWPERWRGVAIAAALSGQAVAGQFGVATAATATMLWLLLALLAGSRRPAPLLPRSAAPRGKGSTAEAGRLERRDGAATGVLAAALLALVVFGAWVPAQSAAPATTGRVPLLLLGAALGIVLALASGAALSVAARRSAIRVGLGWFGAVALLLAAMLSAGSSPEGIVASAIGGLGAAVATCGALRRGASREASPGSAPPGALVPVVAIAAGIAAVSIAWVQVPAIASGVALKGGRTALAAGRPGEAVAGLARATRLAPGYEELPIALARAEQRLAEQATDPAERAAAFERAAAALAAGRARHPGLVVFSLEEAHLAARRADRSVSPAERTDRFAQAVASYRDALARDPQNATAHRGLGAVLLDLGRAPEARIELEASVRLAPRSLETRLMLGRVLLAADDLEGARAAFTAARALDAERSRRLLEGLVHARPQDPTALRDLALFEIIEGRREAALGAIRRAMAMTPPPELPALVRLNGLAARLP